MALTCLVTCNLCISALRRSADAWGSPQAAHLPRLSLPQDVRAAELARSIEDVKGLLRRSESAAAGKAKEARPSAPLSFHLASSHDDESLCHHETSAASHPPRCNLAPQASAAAATELSPAIRSALRELREELATELRSAVEKVERVQAASPSAGAAAVPEEVRAELNEIKALLRSSQQAAKSGHNVRYGARGGFGLRGCARGMPSVGCADVRAETRRFSCCSGPSSPRGAPGRRRRRQPCLPGPCLRRRCGERRWRHGGRWADPLFRLQLQLAHPRGLLRAVSGLCRPGRRRARGRATAAPRATAARPVHAGP